MMNGPRWLMVVLIGLATLRLLGSIGAEEVSDARLLNAYQDATNWLLYGRDYSNQRYSPLDQIKVGNVKTLIPKWAYRTGKVGSFQTSPLVVDGVMYATTPFNHVVALDARNGTPIWRYEHKLRTEKFCCGPANRGAAIGYGKVYTTTIDARLLALDQKTGRVVWDVTIADPEAGKRETVGEVLGVRELQGGIVTGSTGYSSNMAPLVYKGKVIVGTMGVGYGLHLNIKEGDQEVRSEEHTSELQSHSDLVCRLLLEKKKQLTEQVDAINPYQPEDLVGYPTVAGQLSGEHITGRSIAPG